MNDKVKQLILEAIELLDDESSQEAFEIQHNLMRAIALLPEDELHLIVA